MIFHFHVKWIQIVVSHLGRVKLIQSWPGNTSCSLRGRVWEMFNSTAIRNLYQCHFQSHNTAVTYVWELLSAPRTWYLGLFPPNSNYQRGSGFLCQLWNWVHTDPGAVFYREGWPYSPKDGPWTHGEPVGCGHIMGPSVVHELLGEKGAASLSRCRRMLATPCRRKWLNYPCSVFNSGSHSSSLPVCSQEGREYRVVNRGNWTGVF